MSIKVKCRAERELFHRDSFYIISFVPFTPLPDGLELSKYGTFTCKGDLGFATIGKDYTLIIEPVEKNQYGTTYSVKEVPSLQLEELDDNKELEILKEITTESQANYVHEAYPNYIRLILNGEQDKIDVKKIYNVADARNKAYTRIINEKFKYFYLKQKLNDWEVDIDDCKVLYDTFIQDDTIMQEIKTHPYMTLINVLKRSFDSSDRLIMKIIPELKESDQRCEFCILDILDRNEVDGSTRLNGNQMYVVMKDEYNVPELLPKVVDVCENSDLIYYDKKSKDLSRMDTYIGEVRIKEFIKDKLDNSTKLDIDWDKYTQIDGFKMTETQSLALKNLVTYNFSVLAGFSGTGKSTSVQGLIALMEDNSLSYTLLCPTGKASMRLTEAVHRKSSTIHRKCLRDGEINSDVIIIDECSMIDLPTFTMLLSCITNPDCRVVMVGDNAQLMPVGVGCLFNDIINSNVVPTTMLTEIFRYTSNGALYVATNARKGHPFLNEDNDIVKHKGNVTYVGNNYKFIQVDDDHIFDTVLEVYKSLISKHISRDDILCLSAFNVGDVGTYALNNAIQSELNAPKANEIVLTRKLKNDTISFRLDDRIINKKNDYKALPLDSFNTLQSDSMLSSEDVPLTSIFNGQNGIIRDITDKYVVAQFDEDMIVIDKYKLSQVLLSYAISVHSSQGSEADYVINIVSPKHAKMLNRNLLYVADTRSKKFQIDIGDVDTYNKALLIDGNEERNTWLLELLKEGE